MTISLALLEDAFGHELALAWALLMQRPVDPSRLEWTLPHELSAGSFHFIQGPPLGALSAWPAFAVV